MKTLNIILALCLLAGTAIAQDMGPSAGHDLDALWAKAQKTYDLEREDALLLLESRTITVGDEGTVATRVHRVVWIGTTVGIRAYADLRVPWNSATSTLDVEILRTWRDGRWWPDVQGISETAVVHTLPHALDHADDYTAMRETMLLHDGVELPCIVETAYTIAEQGPPTAGADGVFVFPQRDPAVLTEYVLRVPGGTAVLHEELNGAPAAKEDENGVRALTWTVEESTALKLPIATQPAAYEPTVVWTTWEDWGTLESTWSESINAAAVADSVLIEALDEYLAGSLDPVRDTVAFWNESVRSVHYPFRFWQLAPRSATRVWETGYGHALDRAVLLTALLRHVARTTVEDCTKVGCARTEAGYGEVARDLPRLAGFDGLRVELAYGDMGTWLIDPEVGETLDGSAADRWSTSPLSHLLRRRMEQFLSLSLAPGDGDAWRGTGVLRIGSTYDPAVNSDAAAREDRVTRAVQSILPDAEVSAIIRTNGGLSFAVDLAEWPKNADEEPALTVGRIDGGLMDLLPADIHMHEAARQSPLRLPWHLVETVELRLQVDDRDVLTPEPMSMEGATGSFRVDVSREYGWLRVAQRLSLHVDDASRPVGLKDPRRHLHPAESWPELRALLLEAGEPEHGTIVLK